MAFKKLLLISSMLLFSASANSAFITQGTLTWDDTTNIITNNAHNVEYLNLNVLSGLTYAETVAALAIQDGGGWSIATSEAAGIFADSLLSPGTASCDYAGISVGANNLCGTLSGWYDGKLGSNYDAAFDYFIFLDAGTGADYVSIESLTGNVKIHDSSIALNDLNFASGPLTASWIVTRPTAVPIPAAAYLFSSGLLGLIAVARRKARA